MREIGPARALQQGRRVPSDRHAQLCRRRAFIHCEAPSLVSRGNRPPRHGQERGSRPCARARNQEQQHVLRGPLEVFVEASLRASLRRRPDIANHNGSAMRPSIGGVARQRAERRGVEIGPRRTSTLNARIAAGTAASSARVRGCVLPEIVVTVQVVDWSGRSRGLAQKAAFAYGCGSFRQRGA